MSDATFRVHPELRPAPADQPRLSEAVLLELATKQLELTKQSLSMPCFGPPARPGGRPRRLSIHDRDAMIIKEIVAVLAELRR